MRPTRPRPKIGPSTDRHSGGIEVWPLLPLIVVIVYMLAQR